MEIVIIILKWLFFKTILGIVAVAAGIYAISWGAKRIIPKAPNPSLIAIPIGFIALLTVPSIPRYLFEQEVFGQAADKPWIRVTNEAKWGDLTEPLTLIKTPVGSVTMVMPNDPAVGGFKEVVLRYDEKPIVSLVDPDCEDFTILYAQPDDEGTFRYLTRNLASNERSGAQDLLRLRLDA